MGTELLRVSLNDGDIDFPEMPPGFESFTSFKLKKENVENEPSCSVSSSISHQELLNVKKELLNVKTEPGLGGGGKISRFLRRRSGINYGRFSRCSDEDSDSEQQLCHNFPTKPGLPKGVIRGCPDCQNCQKVIARWRPEASCRPELEEAPVFHPSEEEFQDTIRYIEQIRSKAEQYGICRIIPPPSWTPSCPLKEKGIWETFKFVTRVQKVDKLQNRDVSRKMPKMQSHARKKRRRCSRMGVECVSGNGKNFEHSEAGFGFEPGPEFTLDSFQRYADDFKAQYFRADNCMGSWAEMVTSTEKGDPSVEAVEGEYWRVVEKPTEEIEVLYGADLETGVFGSGFSKSTGQDSSSSDEKYVKSGWNLNNLPRLPGSVLSYENADISGVQVPWLYVGMCFSSFCWHVEDHYFYSLNYMHFGAPKMWYGVPGNDAIKLEDAMKKYLPDLFEEQPDLLHKLVTQLSPSILKSAGVPVYRCVQNAGEFILTFPRAYHAGFNCGFNCAEAVNVAPIDWLPHGQNAVELYCEQGRKTTISHDKLLLGAAREAVKANWELNLLRKNTIENLRWKDVCGKNGILAKSLKRRVERENIRREYLHNYAKVLKMETSFDSATERECSICFFDLHLSAVGCRCSPDKFACLIHAKQLCSCGRDDKFFLFRYDITELNLLVDALEGKLSAIYRWARLDLGLVLSSCISKDNGRVMGIMGSFSDHPEESFAKKTNSQLSGCSKGRESIVKIPNDLALSMGKNSSDQRGKLPDTVLALEATRVPPIKLTLAGKRKTEMDSLIKFSRGQDDVICLSDESDDKDDMLDKPVSSARNEMSNVPEMVESDHRLNLCDLANAALAAEADSNLIADVQKDSFSCSTSPIDENDVKCGTVGLSDEHNLSCLQGSMVSSVEKREPDLNASTPDSSIRNTNCGPSVVRRTYMKVLDDARMLPGSPSCNQSSVDKCHRQKGPRIAKVVRRINCNVELLEFGVVIPGSLWSNSRAIFPKGFKSRVKYINLSDPTNMCHYISEILDGGSRGPLFMVYLEHCPSKIFVNVSPTKCWEMVREKVNHEITKQHKMGTLKLPPLQPPGSLDGFEMFGFTSPAIVQVIEALDKKQVCTEYWSTRPLAQISHCFQAREQNRNPEYTNPDPLLRGLLKKASPEELRSLMEVLASNRTLVAHMLNEELQNRSS